MISRTFGWVQNPASTETLRNILSLFVPGSEFNTLLAKERLPLLLSANLFKTPELFLTFQKLLRSKKPIKYDILKGQGAGSGSRSQAKCSGLVQAAITGQQYKEYLIDGKIERLKKPYTDDWTADGFIRWAISLGFLDYNYTDDTCQITNIGKSLVNAVTPGARNKILGQAFLSYPPVCRVLGLLARYDHMTKFEIGANLGFTDEAGFTSFPQNIWVQAFMESTNPEEKKSLLSDIEGSSDKYARMICGWLGSINWVHKKPKPVTESIGGKTYNCEISSAYEITPEGLKNYQRSLADKHSGGVPKIVYREMLASKAPNANYLRKRRSLILTYLSDHKARTIEEIQLCLQQFQFDENTSVLHDDIKGLVNIGLNIEVSANKYLLKDKILKLTPYTTDIANDVTDAVIIKERVRSKLQNIDHKYLTLIDYAFSGKNKCSDFEVYTIDLLVNELDFNGMHLGGSRKPDGIFYYDNRGVIIDNKAYSHGFTITRSMADEMTRYIQENTDRNPERNPNRWWLNFGSGVNRFNYVFISSMFKGEIANMLNNIKQSTGIDGCVITAENLLYYADAIKAEKVHRCDFIAKFGINRELIYSEKP